MRYIALIYSDESQGENASPEAMQQILAEYRQFDAEVKAAGKWVAGDALKGTDTATTIRVRDGKTMMTDGPFAETKEQLGGYYLLECDDLDDALAWAAKIPTTKYGSVEVRPLMIFD